MFQLGATGIKTEEDRHISLIYVPPHHVSLYLVTVTILADEHRL
jgi:hypothetical protein